MGPGHVTWLRDIAYLSKKNKNLIFYSFYPKILPISFPTPTPLATTMKHLIVATFIQIQIQPPIY